MYADEAASIKPDEVLDFLRSDRSFEKYTLALYTNKNGQFSRLGATSYSCGTLGGFAKCGNLCMDGHQNAVKFSMSRNKTVVFRCRFGLLNFAVPFETGNSRNYCIVGGGVQEKPVDLSRVEAIARSHALDPFELLEKLDALPAGSVRELKADAIRVHSLIASLQKESLQSRMLEKATNRLHAVAEVSTQIDKSVDMDAVVSLISEAISILFDIPRILVAVRDQNDKQFVVRGELGLPVGSIALHGADMRALFLHNRDEKAVLLKEDVNRFFPGVTAGSVLCVPMRCADEIVGVLCLFDAELPQRDILLVELLCGRMATKLLLLNKEEENSRENQLLSKFESLASTMTSTENKVELCQNILDAAADLVQATSGSLMLIDETGKSLRIESVKGMNPRLAKSMNLAVGVGIAGKVAVTGEAMLVKDIEQDSRTGITNRSRFKTKSFISIPLKQGSNIVGVLNLSDKKDRLAFTQTDVDLLASVAGQSSLALERADSLARADVLEQRSMDDLPTGLFNRRFMDLRLVEELGRSSRHSQVFSLMLIELDAFTEYCNFCGNPASDRALKKVANLLKTTARQIDIVTRDSDGRFYIILPGTAQRESLIAAERIRSKIESAVFPQEENLPLGTLTVSIGLASYPESGDSADQLLAAVARAQQKALASGGNRVIHCASAPVAGNKVIAIHAVARK
jgi:diguanylate cyclase (GGDEF)-like protein